MYINIVMWLQMKLLTNTLLTTGNCTVANRIVTPYLSSKWGLSLFSVYLQRHGTLQNFKLLNWDLNESSCHTFLRQNDKDCVQHVLAVYQQPEQAQEVCAVLRLAGSVCVLPSSGRQRNSTNIEITTYSVSALLSDNLSHGIHKIMVCAFGLWGQKCV